MRHKTNLNRYYLQKALKAIELIAMREIDERKKSAYDDIYMIAHSWSNCKGHEKWKTLQDDIIKELDN